MEPAPATRFSNPVLIFILSFAGGIFISSFIFVPPLISIFILVIGIAVLTGERGYRGKIEKEVLLIALVTISFSLGNLRYAVKDFHEILMPTETGVVVSEPEDKDNVRRFVFQADNGEKVLVSLPLYHPVQYGDRVRVRGRLERPGVIENEGKERDFDYGKYLAKDDIYHTLSFAEVEVISSGHGHLIRAVLFKIKNNFIEQARGILPEPQASLLMGLIVAGRDALPKDILEDFRRAGVIHIVVLSGFNITLIAEFLRRAFAFLFLKLKWARFSRGPALASIAGVLLFVIMTGGEATVVRAALMSLTVIGANLFGRSYSAPRALLFAGFLMLLENPKILVFDPSFQLSFLATLGLIYFMEPIKKRLGWVTTWWNMRENLSQTLATQLTVLPLLIYSVGDLSLVSIPANLLIITAVPWTMLVGFVTVLLSYLSSLIAWPLAFATHLLLSWILFVSHALGSINFAVIQVSSFWLIIVAYALVMVYILWRKNQRSLREHWTNFTSQSRGTTLP